MGPNYRSPTPAELEVPRGWHAQLPHDGETASIAQWWERFNDPLLTELIGVAQTGSPNVALAEARVREARAVLDATSASFLPFVTADASATRSNGTGATGIPGSGATQTLSAVALNALWDLDFFGHTRRSIEAGEARLASTEAEWHDARVALAAAVADVYAQRRQCEALLGQDQVDLDSRIETHRLTTDKVRAGFSAPADALRTEASVAEGTGVVQNVRGLCARLLNQLAALTGFAHADLALRLEPARATIPLPAPTRIAEIPARALSQRPDVASAERALAAASADIGVAVAERYPRISLLGSIGASRLTIGSSTVRPDTWSFGPSLTLPVFDGGSGAARVGAARARYDQALAAYRQKVRQAVNEVEDALVRTDVALQRERSAQLADVHYQAFFAAKDAQFHQGAANLLEIEDARRLTVASRLTLAAAQLERAQAWIALYRAVGGGWQRADNTPLLQETP